MGVEGDEADAIILATQIALNSDSFIRNYVKSLRRLFEFTEGNDDRADLHLGVCTRSIQGQHNRHLRFKTVAPWYWIEPMGVANEQHTETMASAKGYDPLCTPGCPGQLPMFHRAQVKDQSAFATAAYVDFFCVLHCNLHPKDGLANVRVSQAATRAWSMVGGGKSLVFASKMRKPQQTPHIFLFLFIDFGIPKPIFIFCRF